MSLFVTIDNPDGSLTVMSAGCNTYGQLGLGGKESQSRFVPVPNIPNFVLVASGLNHTVAIDENGHLWVTGYNSSGQLSLGDFKNRKAFERVKNDTIFVKVACGDDHTIAIDSDGFLWGTGNNQVGQLGCHNFENKNVLHKICKVDRKFVEISCGNGHTIARDENGVLWGAGANMCGQLGLPEINMFDEFVEIKASTLFKKVYCGSFHTCAIDANGDLWTTGGNNCGELGIGSTDASFGFEKTKLKNVVDISANFNYTVALDENGHIWVAGSNLNNCLGTGNGINIIFFTKLESSTFFTSVFSNDKNSLLLDENCDIWIIGNPLSNPFNFQFPDQCKLRQLQDYFKQSNKVLCNHKVSQKKQIKSAFS